VVTGSWLTVKEQMASTYAQRLAEAGFVALVFDFTGFGASDGTPRDTESPSRKVRDIHQAISLLADHPQVAKDRIGALGICASSGYTAVNAATDSRVRALAMVAPWLHDAESAAGIYGGPDGVAQRMAAGRKALLRYEETGHVDYVPAVSTTDPAAAMYGAFDYYLDPERGAIPEWSNRHAVMAWPEWLTFDPIPFAARISAPTLLVHSEDGALPDGARRFHAGLAGPGELLWMPGSQFDFYDDPSTVTSAVSHVVAHFDAALR
jgi:dienelactone hydrolase